MTDKTWKPTAQEIAQCEQRWQAASDLLDHTLNATLTDLPNVSRVIGLSDASIVFDYLVATFQRRRKQYGMLAAPTNEAIAAAALTRIVQQARGQDHDMSQFEIQLGHETQ